MPTFSFRCTTCKRRFDVFLSIEEAPPANISCQSVSCKGVAVRQWTPPTVLVVNPIEGRWTTKEYEHLAFDLWPETVQERHRKATARNAEEARRILAKQVQTKVHPREAKRGPVYFPRTA